MRHSYSCAVTAPAEAGTSSGTVLVARIEAILIFGDVIDMARSVSSRGYRLAVGNCAKTVKYESSPAALRRKTPEAYDEPPLLFTAKACPSYI